MENKPTAIELAKQLLSNAENSFHIPWEQRAVAQALLDCEARCEASVRQWQYVLELANAKAVGMLYSDTFSPSRIAEIAHKALASHQATSNPIVSQNNQETSDKEARCEASGQALQSSDEYWSKDARIAELKNKLNAAHHLLNHIHREVASLEDFDAESLMKEIEQTLNGTRVFDDNKILWERIADLEAALRRILDMTSDTYIRATARAALAPRSADGKGE